MRRTVNFGVSWGWPWAGYFKCNRSRHPNLTYIIIFVGKFRFSAKYITFNPAD